jgi:peptidoglycan hydrolase-like protein with peptidoglycan-binding domain
VIRRSVGLVAVILRPGDSNDLARLLQAPLNRDYPLYSNLVVDGIYGPRTPGPCSW